MCTRPYVLLWLHLYVRLILLIKPALDLFFVYQMLMLMEVSSFVLAGQSARVKADGGASSQRLAAVLHVTHRATPPHGQDGIPRRMAV